MFYYFNYFFFIAWNWGLRLAVFTIHHEIKGEKKYNIDTSRIQNVNYVSVKGKNLPNAEMYQGASYYLLEKVFQWLKGQKVSGPIIDFGCGKGRALIVAAAYGFKKVIGIDFAKTLCNEAQSNIFKVRANYPDTTFQVIHEDVVNYNVDEGSNTFFFFNPFNEVVMKQVVNNILLSIKNNPRKCFVVYVNPVHKDVFTSRGFTESFHIRKYTYIEASILTL